jgi:hypothetical protein
VNPDDDGVRADVGDGVVVDVDRATGPGQVSR